jgi:hypothetical protein
VSDSVSQFESFRVVVGWGHLEKLPRAAGCPSCKLRSALRVRDPGHLPTALKLSIPSTHHVPRGELSGTNLWSKPLTNFTGFMQQGIAWGSQATEPSVKASWPFWACKFEGDLPWFCISLISGCGVSVSLP